MGNEEETDRLNMIHAEGITTRFIMFTVYIGTKLLQNSSIEKPKQTTVQMTFGIFRNATVCFHGLEIAVVPRL